MTDGTLCASREVKIMSHSVSDYLQTNLDGGLNHLHLDVDALVNWLATYGMHFMHMITTNTTTKL